MDDWVFLMTGYFSVDNLEKAISETRKQFEQSQLQLHTTQQAEAALQSKVASLTAQMKHLWSCLQDLNHAHNELINHSMEQHETISSLRSRFISRVLNVGPISQFL